MAIELRYKFPSTTILAKATKPLDGLTGIIFTSLIVIVCSFSSYALSRLFLQVEDCPVNFNLVFYETSFPKV